MRIFKKIAMAAQHPRSIGMTVPSADWLNAAIKDTLYTPDAVNLERKQAQLFFIYNDLMDRRPRHNIINPHVELLCVGFTKGRYTMWEKNNGKEVDVVVMDTSDETDSLVYGLDRPGVPCKVRGELYVMRSPGYFALDEHMKNTVQFVRQRVEIDVHYRRARGTKGILADSALMYTVRAWMYVGVPDYWDKILDGGYLSRKADVYEPRHSDRGPYYFHSQPQFRKQE